MSDGNLQDHIAAADAYEQLHVPALFEEWVEPVLDAAGVEPGDRVLDIACGTGVLARGARKRVGPDGRVAGVDPGPGMLAVAERIEPDVDWHAGTAELLPFPDRSFDAVVSQFGMMFFTDGHEAIREMLRVLDGDGRLTVAVWDALENHPAYVEEVALLERIAGREAADALRAPFVLGDAIQLATSFEDAEVDDVSVATLTGTARFPSIRSMVEADLRGWLPVMGVRLEEEEIDTILAEAESTLAAFVTQNGQVVFDSPAHIVSGGRP